MNNKILYNKIAKGVVSFAAIILLLSSILATSLYYNNNITANAVREAESEYGHILVTEVDELQGLSYLNEGWYEIRSGFVFYLDTFNSYVPLYIKILNQEQQNGLLAIDEYGAMEFGTVVNLLKEKEVVDKDEAVQNKITGNAVGLEKVTGFASQDRKVQMTYTNPSQVTKAKIINEVKRQEPDPVRQQQLIPKAVAIAGVESGYNQKAISRRTDIKTSKTEILGIGIFQLNPSTAKSLGVDPYNEDQNIKGGIAYLREQLNNFNNPTLAYAAFNAGPNAVKKNGVLTGEENQKFVTRVAVYEKLWVENPDLQGTYLATYYQPSLVSSLNDISVTGLTLVRQYTVAERIVNLNPLRPAIAEAAPNIPQNFVIKAAGSTEVAQLAKEEKAVERPKLEGLKPGTQVYYNGELDTYVGQGPDFYSLSSGISVPFNDPRLSTAPPAFSTPGAFASSRFARLSEIYTISEDGKVKDKNDKVIAQLSANFDEYKNQNVMVKLSASQARVGTADIISYEIEKISKEPKGETSKLASPIPQVPYLTVEEWKKEVDKQQPWNEQNLKQNFGDYYIDNGGYIWATDTAGAFIIAKSDQNLLQKYKEKNVQVDFHGNIKSPQTDLAIPSTQVPSISKFSDLKIGDLIDGQKITEIRPEAGQISIFVEGSKEPRARVNPNDEIGAVFKVTRPAQAAPPEIVSEEEGPSLPPRPEARDKLLEELRSKGATSEQIAVLRLHMTEGEQAEITSDGSIIRTIVSSGGEQTGALSVYNKKGENIAFIAPEGDIFENQQITSKQEVMDILSKAQAIVPEQIKKTLARQTAPAPKLEELTADEEQRRAGPSAPPATTAPDTAPKAEAAKPKEEAPVELLPPSVQEHIVGIILGVPVEDNQEEYDARIIAEAKSIGTFKVGSKEYRFEGNNIDDLKLVEIQRPLGLGWFGYFNKDVQEEEAREVLAGYIPEKEAPNAPEREQEAVRAPAPVATPAGETAQKKAETTVAAPVPPIAEQAESLWYKPWTWSLFRGEQKPAETETQTPKTEPIPAEKAPISSRQDIEIKIKDLEKQYGEKIRQGADRSELISLEIEIGRLKNTAPPSEKLVKIADAAGIDFDELQRRFGVNQITVQDISDELLYNKPLKPGYEYRVNDETKELNIYAIGAKDPVHELAVPNLFRETKPAATAPASTPNPSILPIAQPAPPTGIARVFNYYHDEKTGEVYSITLGQGQQEDFYYKFNPGSRSWDILPVNSPEVLKIRNPSNDDIKIRSFNDVQTIIQNLKAASTEQPSPPVTQEDVRVAGLSDEESRQFAREQGLIAQAGTRTDVPIAHQEPTGVNRQNAIKASEITALYNLFGSGQAPPLLFIKFETKWNSAGYYETFATYVGDDSKYQQFKGKTSIGYGTTQELRDKVTTPTQTVVSVPLSSNAIREDFKNPDGFTSSVKRESEGQFGYTVIKIGGVKNAQPEQSPHSELERKIPNFIADKIDWEKWNGKDGYFCNECVGGDSGSWPAKDGGRIRLLDKLPTSKQGYSYTSPDGKIKTREIYNTNLQSWTTINEKNVGTPQHEKTWLENYGSRGSLLYNYETGQPNNLKDITVNIPGADKVVIPGNNIGQGNILRTMDDGSKIISVVKEASDKNIQLDYSKAIGVGKDVSIPFEDGKGYVATKGDQSQVLNYQNAIVNQIKPYGKPEDWRLDQYGNFICAKDLCTIYSEGDTPLTYHKGDRFAPSEGDQEGANWNKNINALNKLQGEQSAQAPPPQLVPPSTPQPAVTYVDTPGPKFINTVLDGKIITVTPPSGTMKSGTTLAYEHHGYQNVFITKQSDGSWKGDNGVEYIWNSKIGWIPSIPSFVPPGPKKFISVDDPNLVQALNLLGYQNFDNNKEAITQFQRDNNLKLKDGLPGDETLGKINELLDRQKIVFQQKENAQSFNSITQSEFLGYGSGSYRIDSEGYIHQTLYGGGEYIMGVADRNLIANYAGYSTIEINEEGQIIRLGQKLFTPAPVPAPPSPSISPQPLSNNLKLIVSKTIDENAKRLATAAGRDTPNGDDIEKAKRDYLKNLGHLADVQALTNFVQNEYKYSLGVPSPSTPPPPKPTSLEISKLTKTTSKIGQYEIYTDQASLPYIDLGQGEFASLKTIVGTNYYAYDGADGKTYVVSEKGEIFNEQTEGNTRKIRYVDEKGVNYDVQITGKEAKFVSAGGSELSVENLKYIAKEYSETDFSNIVTQIKGITGINDLQLIATQQRALTEPIPSTIPSLIPTVPSLQGEAIDPSKIKINPAIVPGAALMPSAGEQKTQLPPSVTGQRPIHQNYVQMPDKSILSVKVYQSDSPDFVYGGQFKIENGKEVLQKQFLLHKSQTDKINWAQWNGDLTAIPLQGGGFRNAKLCAENSCSFTDFIQVKDKPRQEIETSIKLGAGGMTLEKNVVEKTGGVETKNIFFDSVSGVTRTIAGTGDKRTVSFEIKDKDGTRKIDVDPSVYDAVKSKNPRDDNVINYFFGEAAKQGFSRLDKDSLKDYQDGLGYIGDLKGKHIILLDSGKIATKQGDTLLGFIDREKGLSATVQGPAIIDPNTKNYVLQSGGTAFVDQRTFDGALTSKRVEQQSKDSFTKVEYFDGKQVTYFGATASVNGKEYTITPISDRNNQLYGYLELNPKDGGATLYLSTGEPNIWNPFGGGNVYKKGSDDKLEKVDDKEAIAVRNAMDAERQNRNLPTFAQISSQRFFANVDRVLTDFQGFGYYATLFFDEDSLLKWRDNVDRTFATFYLGTEYWSSAICGEYLDGEDDGIAYAETPQGLAQVAAHVEATRTEPILTPTGEEFIYKITFNVRNGDYNNDPRAPEEMHVNVILRGEKTVPIFKEEQKIKRGSSFGRTGRNAIVQDSTVFYTEICLTFDKTPLRWKVSNNEVCNTIVESSGIPTTVAATASASSQGSGAVDGDINDF